MKKNTKLAVLAAVVASPAGVVIAGGPTTWRC